MEGGTIKVCKQFFLGMLSISNYMAYYHFKHAQKGAANKRRRQTKRKVPREDRNFFIQHINSFPRVDSHNCRSSSNKQCLDAQLNACEMYRLYEIKCSDVNRKPVKQGHV